MSGDVTREQLELAAKAAGLYWRDWTPNTPKTEMDVIWPYDWNPRADDGDALRLSRALQMTVAFEPSRGGWSVGAIVNGEFKWLTHDDDQCLAIFLAAVEIGRATP